MSQNSNSEPSSGVVDFDDKAANMYGCYPCPKCASPHRYSSAGVVLCDECGHKEAMKEPSE